MALLAGCSSGVANCAGIGAISIDPTFNKADVKFAQTMIPHHEQAIEMSDTVLAKPDVTPELTKIAQQARDAQLSQVTTMKDLLTAWRQPLVPDHGAEADEDHWDAEGVLTPEEMQAIAAADSPSAQQLFLEGIIQHHEGAVVMVQDEIDNGENGNAVKPQRIMRPPRPVFQPI